MALVKEFKAFVTKGNVVDLAVGVIIGAAFGKIISSLVDRVIMPPIGILLGSVNFTDLKFVLQQSVMDGAQVIKPEVAIGYGAFIQTVIDFIIIGACIFFAVKIYHGMLRRREETPPPPSPTNEETLLKEIRDILKNK